MTLFESALDLPAPIFTAVARYVSGPGNLVWIVDFDGSSDPANWILYVGVIDGASVIDPGTVTAAVDVENWEDTAWENTQPTRAQIAETTERIGRAIRFIYGI